MKLRGKCGTHESLEGTQRRSAGREEPATLMNIPGARKEEIRALAGSAKLAELRIALSDLPILRVERVTELRRAIRARRYLPTLTQIAEALCRELFQAN